MDLTTISALRGFGSVISESDDVLLAAIISAASRTIEKYCDRTFAVAEETIHVFTRRGYTDPFDGPVLLLDGELAEPASLITDSPSVTYLPPYEVPHWGILLDEGSWSPPVSVTGYWAYSKEAPPDIELACLRLSKWMYELRDSTRGDAVVVTEQGAVLLPADLPADVMAIIKPYRKLKMAR